MKKIYIDATQMNANVSITVKDAEVIYAGATICSMPARYRSENEEYATLADKYDLRFIFDDCDLAIDFYTVPQVDIFATDSKGGFFAYLPDTVDGSSPICYIDAERKCYDIADSMKDLLTKIKKGRIQNSDASLTKNITVYKSKEEAKKQLNFIDVPPLPESTDGPTAYYITLDDDSKA